MNPWPFVIAAYAAAIGGTAVLLLWAYASMRRAETAAAALKRRDSTAVAENAGEEP